MGAAGLVDGAFAFSYPKDANPSAAGSAMLAGGDANAAAAAFSDNVHGTGTIAAKITQIYDGTNQIQRHVTRTAEVAAPGRRAHCRTMNCTFVVVNAPRKGPSCRPVARQQRPAAVDAVAGSVSTAV